MQVHAGHLKAVEEENFVQQAEKIVLSSKNKTAGGGPAITEQPQETKLDKTEPSVTTGETTSAKSAGQLTPRLAPRGSHQAKSSSPLSNSVTDTSASSSQKSDSGVNGGTSRPLAKVINEVTGEVVAVVGSESAAISSRSDSDRERERPGRVPEVALSQQRPLTRDVATGMSPATNSSSVVSLGSQSSGGDEAGGGRKVESPPSLSTQTSDEVRVYEIRTC